MRLCPFIKTFHIHLTHPMNFINAFHFVVSTMKILIYVNSIYRFVSTKNWIKCNSVQLHCAQMKNILFRIRFCFNWIKFNIVVVNIVWQCWNSIKSNIQKFPICRNEFSSMEFALFFRLSLFNCERKKKRRRKRKEKNQKTFDVELLKKGSQITRVIIDCRQKKRK